MLSTNVKIPEEDHAELLKLARVGERTLAGEIRLAIRRHISAENRNASAASLPESAAEASTTGG